MTAIGSHSYWNDAPLESLPLTPPNAPFFPEPSLSASGRAKLGHEFASYPLLLPPLPIQKPHARQATSERWIADVPAMNFHPAWSSYNTHDRRIRNKHGSGNTKSLNPSPNGPNARQEVQSRVSASFASGMASSRSMGTNSLRVDTTLANGDMSSNRGTVATGGMINHQPTPGHATNVSGHAMQELGSRSMSPARSSGSSTAVTSTNPSPSKRQWSASMLGHGLGGEHPTSESEPDPFTRVQQSTKSVEEFQGTNYPSWRYWFKRKITNPSTGKNLWGHIDGTRPRPKEPSVGCDRKDGDGSDPVERWDMDEAAIYCSLFASISSGIARDQVQACTTAKEVWERLEMLYGDPDISTTRAAQIIRELSQVVYTPGDDLQQHLMGMEGLISKLNKGPYPIPDSLAVWFICDSMPACFLAEVQRLRNSKELSIESVIQRLKAVGDDILGDMCKSKVRYIQTVRRATALPLDLRAYKYGGDGEAGDGQLYRRSQSTCQACLGTGHQALSQECPQTEVRHGLWGKGAGLLSCVGETSPKVVKANSAPNTHRTQEPAFPSNNTSWVHMRRTDTKVKGARNGTYRLVPGQFPEAERTSWRAL